MPDDGQMPGGEASARHRKKKKRSAGRIIAKTIGWIFLTLFTLLVIGVLTLGIFARIFMTYVDTTLRPSLGIATAEERELALASTMYDANGAAMLTLFDNSEETGGGNRELIEFGDLPQHLIDALVAIEDKRFWEHRGVDWIGTASAIKSTITGGATRGGSTITQQVLRDKYQDTEVTVKRKFREILRALEYEKYTSKEDIITDYLNRVYFGAGCNGIQTAAKTFFGKDVSELDLAESACIIGITNNPSLYDPFHKASWKQDDGSYKTPRIYNKERQELILDEMCRQGKIDEATRDAAKAEKLRFTDTDEYKALHGLEVPDPDEEDEGEEVVDTGNFNTWFQDAAINEAIDLLVEQKGYAREDAAKFLYRQGYHIETTFDPDVQAVVDSIYQDPSNFDYPSAEGTPLASAITVIDPYTGDVKAMAGGVGQKTANRELNLATTRRKPGSAIKPVSVYAPGIEYDVVSPGSIIDDYPINTVLRDNGYPRNSTVGTNSAGGYSGYRTVSYGVQQSLNTIAARTLQKVSYARSFEFMENNLGFDLDPADIDMGPLAMGGLTYGVTTVEMAAAYSAFANQGIYTKPRLVTRIWNNDRTEVVVDNDSGVRSWPAMKETTAWLVNRMLRNVVTNGTGTRALFDGMSIAGKTGTTNNNFDRYFVGYTPYYSAAVWIGYRDKDEKITAKGNPAAVIWKQVMEPLHEGLEDRSFPDRPEGIARVEVCADCGLKPSALCSQDYRGGRVITVEVQASAVPRETCVCHTEVRVCTNPETGEVRLAGDYCPEETVTTRVMLVGREHLERPDGSIILAGDSEAHLSYFSTLGTCALHDEFYVPLPPDEWGEPLPGDPGYEWPTEPWNPDDVLPPNGGNSADPGPQPPEPAEPEEPSQPEGPDLANPDIEGPASQEPDGPLLPEEPILP